jgi:hypothetical protein
MKILENPMRKGTVLLALVFAVSATTVASAAKKQAADPSVVAQNQSLMFLSDAMHPWATTPAPTHKMKAKKKKK